MKRILLVTLVFVVVYVGIQQYMRIAFNSPLVVAAESAASKLGGGDVPASVVPRTFVAVDLTKSNNQFTAVFDEKGMLLESSASLGKLALPSPPIGVFTYTKEHGEDRITWAPMPGVRLATVVVHYEGARPGFVLVGRSLGETESHIKTLGYFALSLWALTIILCLTKF